MGVKLGNGKWAIKEDKLLAYNDNSGRFFNKEFDFSRGSSATYVAKDGLIENTTGDIPRIDFTDTSKGALLLEPQSTNLLTYSEDFSQWAKTGAAAITSNYGISPDGSQNSSRVLFSNASEIVRLNFTATNNVIASIYIKGTEGETIRFGLQHAETNFTLTGDWQRIDRYRSGGHSSGSENININTYAGSTARDIEIFGAQVEQKSYATSYIPTYGSTATRLADLCNNSGSAQDFNSEEGVLYAEIAALSNDGTSRRISLSDGGSSDRLEIFYGTIANRIDYHIYSGSSFQASGFSLLSSATDFNKIAVKYKENDFALWVNGTEASTDPSGNTPIGLNKLQLQDATGSNDFYGNVRSVAVFKQALTDGELAKITSTTQQEVFYEMRDRMLQIDADYYEFGDYTTRLKKLF